MNAILSGSDYTQLRAFLAVAGTLSFSRAAAALGVTASALSQTIRALEDGLGLRLLQRTTRSVSLTEAGEALLRRIGPAVSELGAAFDQARQTGNRPAGTVRVHSFRSAAAKFIEPMLAPFATNFPDIVLDITLDDSVTDIAGGGFDVALRIGEVIERDMVAVRLGPAMRQIAVATPTYLAEHGTPAHPRALLNHRCIRWRWPGRAQPYAWEFFEAGKWFEIAVSGPLILNDKDTAIRAALAGIGIAFCTEESVAPHLAAGRLVALLGPWAEPFDGIFLCYPRQNVMAPALRAFIDAVREAA